MSKFSNKKLHTISKFQPISQVVLPSLFQCGVAYKCRRKIMSLAPGLHVPCVHNVRYSRVNEGGKLLLLVPCGPRRSVFPLWHSVKGHACPGCQNNVGELHFRLRKSTKTGCIFPDWCDSKNKVQFACVMRTQVPPLNRTSGRGTPSVLPHHCILHGRTGQAPHVNRAIERYIGEYLSQLCHLGFRVA